MAEEVYGQWVSQICAAKGAANKDTICILQLITGIALKDTANYSVDYIGMPHVIRQSEFC